MLPETSSPDLAIHLRRQSSSVSGGDPPPTFAITISLSGGVDLGLVGRVLGLDPNTVRLNGYYVSRSGSYHVSTGLSWGPLLHFFSQRGLPFGVGVGDAIVVQGKHMGSTEGNPFIKRKFQLETGSSFKKRKLERNYKPKENGTLCTKRSLNSDDVPVPFKNMNMAHSNTGMQKSHTETTFSHLTIYLRLYSVGSCSALAPNRTITVSLSSPVDLRLVGLVLGLDPNTVRLNGYYLSRTRPHYMSPGLSWGSLLDFFAQRGLPCGSEVQDAVLIQGKYASLTGWSADCNRDGSLFLKRKAGLDTECPEKKRRLTNCKSNENLINRPKRTINSDDVRDPFKKMKTACSNTVTWKPHASMHISRVSRLAIRV